MEVFLKWMELYRKSKKGEEEWSPHRDFLIGHLRQERNM